jgi:hypothetical protein
LTVPFSVVLTAFARFVVQQKTATRILEKSFAGVSFQDFPGTTDQESDGNFTGLILLLINSRECRKESLSSLGCDPKRQPLIWA